MGQIDLVLSGSVSDTMTAKINLTVKDYFQRCDQRLLSTFGCLCKVVEAIQLGRVQQVEHWGKYKLVVDGEVLESMDAEALLGTFPL